MTHGVSEPRLTEPIRPHQSRGCRALRTELRLTSTLTPGGQRLHSLSPRARYDLPQWVASLARLWGYYRFFLMNQRYSVGITQRFELLVPYRCLTLRTCRPVLRLRNVVFRPQRLQVICWSRRHSKVTASSPPNLNLATLDPVVLSGPATISVRPSFR